MLGLTHALARELGPDGITVNCLVPEHGGHGDGQRTSASRWPPSSPSRSFRSYQQPDDLVGAILWLASPASRFTTGQTVMAEGGRIFL